jgi:hypothetical protein
MACLAALLCPVPAQAGPGGSVVGTVRVAGEVRTRPALRVSVDPGACGESLADEALLVGSAGEVRNAVVVLRGGPPAGAPPAGEVLVDNAGCRFVPRVQVAMRGQTVRVRNSDPVLHNAHPVVVAEPEVSIANLALGAQGQTMDLTRRLAAKLPTGPEVIVRFGCDVHPWMRGWLVVVENARAAVTDAHGAFAIRDLPSGSYAAAVWHETLGRSEQAVTVPPGATARLEVAFTP